MNTWFNQAFTISFYVSYWLVSYQWSQLNDSNELITKDLWWFKDLSCHARPVITLLQPIFLLNTLHMTEWQPNIQQFT